MASDVAQAWSLRSQPLFTPLKFVGAKTCSQRHRLFTSLKHTEQLVDAQKFSDFKKLVLGCSGSRARKSFEHPIGKSKLICNLFCLVHPVADVFVVSLIRQ